MFLVTSAVVYLDVQVQFDLHSRVMLHCSEQHWVQWQGKIITEVSLTLSNSHK